MVCAGTHRRTWNVTIFAVFRLLATAMIFPEMSTKSMAYVSPYQTFTRSSIQSPPSSATSHSSFNSPLLHVTSKVRPSVLFSTTSNGNDQKTDNKSDDGEAVLTDVDARVLQAMLREDKLNLDEEENLKQLLERGIRAKEPAQRPVVEPEESSEYKSTAFKKLTNTKLWKAFRRSADDWVESAKIFVSNRIERDSKLLGALGLFAFERAMKDVSRALPATATKSARKVFQLGNTTSYKPPRSDDEDFLQDMKTPADEFKSVSEDIKQIFKSGGSVTGSTSRRGLKSTAPAGMAKSRERFARAYQRKQETTLKKERENVVQKGGRAVSGVVDIGWELRRELEVEPNKAGYRTKALREGAMKTAGQLKAGATKILEAAKRKDRDLRLEASSSAQSAPVIEEKKLRNAAASAKPRSSFAFSTIPELHRFMKQEQSNLIQRLTECVDDPSVTWLKTELLTDEEVENLDASVVEPVINALVKAQKILELEQEDEEVHLVDPGLPSSVVTHQLLISLQEGKEWIDRVLKAAKDTGSSTIVALLEMKLLGMNDDSTDLSVYLRLEQLTQQASDLEEFEREAASREMGSSAPVQSVEKQDMKKASSDFSFFATPETRPVEEERTENAFFATPEKRSAEEKEAEGRPPPFNTIPMRDVGGEFVDKGYTSTTSKYVDAITEPNEGVWSPPWASSPQDDWAVEAQVVREESMMGDASAYMPGQAMDPTSFTAELVSDDDFEDAVGTYKAAVAAFDEEEDENRDGPNFLVQLSLRTFDIIFFVAEKALVRKKFCTFFNIFKLPLAHHCHFLSSYSFWFQVSSAWERELQCALRMRRVKVWARRAGKISVLCRKGPNATNQAFSQLSTTII